MFRAGEVSLGNQLLTVEVQKTLEEHHQPTSDPQPTLLEILVAYFSQNGVCTTPCVCASVQPLHTHSTYVSCVFVCV